MSIARGEVHQISYIEELAYGDTPPTPDMLELWHNSEGLTPQRQPFQSGRMLGDRQLADVRMGRKSGAGSITSELCYANFDPFLVAVLTADANFPTAFTQITGTDISATADIAADSVGGGTFDIVTVDGFIDIEIGDFIEVAGFTDGGGGEDDNNGIWYVTGKASNLQVTVVPTIEGQSIMVDATAGDSVTIDQLERITNGLTETSFSVELRYTDIARYHVYRGGVLNTLGINVPANGIVGADWGWMFKNYEEAGVSLDDNPTLAGDYSPFDGLSGSYLEGSIASQVMTAINLNINNNYMMTEALGSDEAGEAIPRKLSFDGNVTYYKEDDSISNKFYSEIETMIEFTLTDPDGNSYTITLPRVKYTSLNEGKGDDGPIMTRLGYMAYRFFPTLKSIYITRS